MGENTPIQRQMNTKSIIFDNKIFLLKKLLYNIFICQQQIL